MGVGTQGALAPSNVKLPGDPVVLVKPPGEPVALVKLPDEPVVLVKLPGEALKTGEVVSPPTYEGRGAFFPIRGKSDWQLPVITCSCVPKPFSSMSPGGWRPPFPTERRWLGLPKHNCHSVAG